MIADSGKALHTARWLMVGLLAVIAALLVAALCSSSPSAMAQTTMAVQSNSAPGNVMAFSGQLSQNVYGLYLVDMQNATICVYQYFPTERKLRLMAARTYLYDRQLDEYSTEPSPSEVSKWIGNARRLKDVPPATQP